MGSYVRKRLEEIKADPALRRRPAKPLSFQKQAAMVAKFLAALGHETRLLTCIHLMDGERTVMDLLSRVGGSQHSLSQHLGILVEMGILESRAERTWRYYSCKSEDAKAVIRVLDVLARTNALPSSPSGPLERP
ncbi:ArsR/SmtB family transcription factor [Mesorhizobium sp. B263B2A]|jgi:ArsR family transcriptional regulator, virulence genes transcriptional regulator|uniref:ArsR/SmtB family transcription factor n=1 Tax=Mesorhizobium sp. B263B2A TaxID=2876669 RepID=UPI001CD115B5|nr:metalloregulator ArsR/SmtB family transcription factor [Mesorhizobium sp. B263B2A]MCA0035517.1 metalloregulator ArsR/SmtB family transcription factor [Mesorhizobium sp. B263B2A]